MLLDLYDLVTLKGHIENEWENDYFYIFQYN